MANKHDELSQQIVGWHIQSQAPNPWTVPGNTGSLVTTGQAGISPNPGYADGTAHSSAAAVAPAVPASLAVATNNSGFVATVVISGGTLTVVKVGVAGQNYAAATQVGTTAGTYIVPPNGVIGIAYTVAPTWTWTT